MIIVFHLGVIKSKIFTGYGFAERHFNS